MGDVQSHPPPVFIIFPLNRSNFYTDSHHLLWIIAPLVLTDVPQTRQSKHGSQFAQMTSRRYTLTASSVKGLSKKCLPAYSWSTMRALLRAP